MQNASISQVARRRVVGYVRVSSNGQKDNYSVPEQGKRIQAYCDLHDLELVAIFQEVGSGANTSRAGFKEAIRCIWGNHYAAAEVDGLVVWDFWRFSRNNLDSEAVRMGFEKRGKLLLSFNQSFDLNSPSGIFAFQVTQAAGEMDRKNICNRLYGLRKAKAEAGSWIGHGVPFGLKVQKTKVGGRVMKSLIKDDATWPVVELILQANGTTRDIADMLNAQGVPSPNGTPWNNVTVWKIKKRDYNRLAG